MNKLTFLGPGWDSILRSGALFVGTTLAVTGKVSPDRFSHIFDSFQNVLGAGTGLAAAIWGATRGVANAAPPVPK